jgi:NADPH2:quinone reductase
MNSATTHAVQLTEYGPPEALRFEVVDLAPLRADEVRIRAVASAVNHTDIEIRAGHWPIRKQQPFPYVPGVEVVGEIDEVGSAVTTVSVGDQVITMMQGMGGVRAERAGGYAELVTVAADAVATVPPTVDPYAIAALGLGAVTAYWGLRRIGNLAGKRVFVTGAAGGVGSAAVALARAQGASVVGVVSRAEQIGYVEALGAEDVVVSSRTNLASFKTNSVDGILETVGAALFETCIAALKPDGVLSLVGAVGGSDVRFDLWNLIRPITLTGYSTENLDGDALRDAVNAISGWLMVGAIAAPSWATVPLQDAAIAHAMLERKGVNGRLLLVPSTNNR